MPLSTLQEIERAITALTHESDLASGRLDNAIQRALDGNRRKV